MTATKKKLKVSGKNGVVSSEAEIKPSIRVGFK